MGAAMTQRVRYAPDKFARSNAELDRRCKVLIARKTGAGLEPDSALASLGVRVLNAANLSPEERQRYGLSADWVPGRRRKATGKRRTTTYYR